MSTLSTTPVTGGRGGQSRLARFVDHGETYGPRAIEEFLRGAPRADRIMDIGAGGGRDLGIAAAVHPSSTRIAVEAYGPYVERLERAGVTVHQLDIERQPLPAADGSLDVIIANQVLEHTKEVFWIFHEMTRALAVGGSLLIGVPNLLSFHNRVLAMAGRHATQHKLVSAHVRPFSRRDTELFLATCFPGGYEVRAVRGSQFYPLPPALARRAADRFPGAAFSLFFHLVKVSEYHGSFLEHPVRAELETNFFVGQRADDAQRLAG
jgi:SAM-dependent methyltransferase